ncbi:MAG: hypothetical protein CMH59_05945 [Myxococcales bacterium]|nr:hypothetical protein [Myxococcales bacterium]
MGTRDRRASKTVGRGAALLALTMALGMTLGCDEGGAPEAQRALLQEHVPRVKELLRQDRERHRAGVREAAQLLKRGFGVPDAETRERQMRVALGRIQQPAARGSVPQFIASPMAFLAAVDIDGTVIARDSDEDHMAGQQWKERYASVREALEEGNVTYELAEFPAIEEGQPSSFSMIFTAPVQHEGQRVGAVTAGIPLWREAQRLSRQLRIDHAEAIEAGLTLWVYMYRGDRVFYGPDAPPELNEVVPDAATRQAGLERSPGGFTRDLQLYTRWYGYAVVPTPAIGEDAGIIVFRAEAP